MISFVQAITIDFKRFSKSRGNSTRHDARHGLAPIDIERLAKFALEMGQIDHEDAREWLFLKNHVA